MYSMEDEDDDLTETLARLCQLPSVNIIDIEDVTLHDGARLGSGTFGVVRKGTYRRRGSQKSTDGGRDEPEDVECAIKVIWSNEEIRAFVNEVTQLSRVCHENIVTIYGAHIGKPCYLVMEYAAGGSLYNVLHCKPYSSYVRYSMAHAISWCLQCMKGINYLHNMEPKPLVHRDIKPPNLLLVGGMLTLKICDFGTACDLATNMTNCKGSAAWMAPEVFSGNRYTQKCDIFSWGIILWEVLSRQKPYERMSSAYQIMWAIQCGLRPPLLSNAPKVITDLMQKCWHREAAVRPTSTEIVSIMTRLSGYCDNAANLVPLYCPVPLKSSSTFSTISASSTSADDCQSVLNGIPIVGVQKRPNALLMEGLPTLTTTNFDHLLSPDAPSISQQQITASTQMSQDRSETRGASKHRRQLSAGLTDVSVGGTASGNGNILGQRLPPPPAMLLHARKSSWPADGNIGDSYEDFGLRSHMLVEPKLQPLPPLTDSVESVQIYEQHKRACQRYLKQQREIELLLCRSKELDQLLQDSESDASRGVRVEAKYIELCNEQHGLMQMKQRLKQQLNYLQHREVDDSWEHIL